MVNVIKSQPLSLLLLFILLACKASPAICVTKLQDPTAPPSARKAQHNKPQQTGLPKLRAIMVEEQRKIAIFDKSSKQLGQTIAGYKLHKIAADHIVLQKNNRFYRLNIFPSWGNESKRN